MTAQAAAYLATGLVLVAALAAITAHVYARKRRDRVEEPKYKMLDDDD